MMTERCTDKYMITYDRKTQDIPEIKVSFNIFPTYEIFILHGPKPIIIILFFSQALIGVNLHLVNALFNTKKFIIYLLRIAEKYKVAHCAPWLIVPHSPLHLYQNTTLQNCNSTSIQLSGDLNAPGVKQGDPSVWWSYVDVVR